MNKYGDDLTTLQIESLNLAEELALRIIYSNTTNHTALKSIKPGFIKLVEISALVLIRQREIITGNQIFSGTLELYNKWKGEVDRSSPQDRAEKIVLSLKNDS